MIKFIILLAMLNATPVDTTTQKPILPNPVKIELSTVQTVDTLIQHYGKMYNVPLKYLYTLTWHESRFDTSNIHFNPAVQSYAGASGIFQMMPGTALATWKDSGYIYQGKLLPKNHYGISELLKKDIDFNIHSGIKHISDLYQRYNDWPTVFRVYASGSPYAGYNYSYLIVNGIR